MIGVHMNRFTVGDRADRFAARVRTRIASSSRSRATTPIQLSREPTRQGPSPPGVRRARTVSIGVAPGTNAMSARNHISGCPPA